VGGSITLATLRCLSGVKVVGYTHRAATRRRARQLAVATEIANDMAESVSKADLVIIATPVCTFEQTFEVITDALPAGCIVTDVGSTKVLAHRWASKKLRKTSYYVGSHPIAGSEQRGVEFARDDLFERTTCILTTTRKTNHKAVQTVKRFWSSLGCSVKLMTPVQHDRILANVSHVPHIVAAALINASDSKELKFAGTGFIDTSRVASGPANIWADVLLTNANNATKGIDKIGAELAKLKTAIRAQDRRQIEKLLEKARNKRKALVKYKMRRDELI
jgi:prephenate dehydrogenase